MFGPINHTIVLTAMQRWCARLKIKKALYYTLFHVTCFDEFKILTILCLSDVSKNKLLQITILWWWLWENVSHQYWQTCRLTWENVTTIHVKWLIFPITIRSVPKMKQSFVTELWPEKKMAILFLGLYNQKYVYINNYLKISCKWFWHIMGKCLKTKIIFLNCTQ